MMSFAPSIWISLGIIACIGRSTLFAGLNLAIFSLSPVRLEIEVDGGHNRQQWGSVWPVFTKPVNLKFGRAVSGWCKVIASPDCADAQ
jgi:hypothetical protein